MPKIDDSSRVFAVSTGNEVRTSPRVVQIQIPDQQRDYARTLLFRMGVSYETGQFGFLIPSKMEASVMERLRAQGISPSRSSVFGPPARGSEASYVHNPTEAQRVSSLLERRGFQTTIRERYVEACHVQHGKTFLVRIGESSHSQGREILHGCLIFTRLDFADFVDNLVGYWGKPFAPYGLGNDMLTMFGWHMRSSVSERHGSLMGATTALGPRHVREILNLLKATVPRNPRFAHYPEYGTNTADDYEWYAQEVADQLGPYWEQRRDLIRWIRDAWVKSSSAGVTTFDYYFLILPDMKAS